MKQCKKVKQRFDWSNRQNRWWGRLQQTAKLQLLIEEKNAILKNIFVVSISQFDCRAQSASVLGPQALNALKHMWFARHTVAVSERLSWQPSCERYLHNRYLTSPLHLKTLAPNLGKRTCDEQITIPAPFIANSFPAMKKTKAVLLRKWGALIGSSIPQRGHHDSRSKAEAATSHNVRLRLEFGNQLTGAWFSAKMFSVFSFELLQGRVLPLRLTCLFWTVPWRICRGPLCSDQLKPLRTKARPRSLALKLSILRYFYLSWTSLFLHNAVLQWCRPQQRQQNADSWHTWFLHPVRQTNPQAAKYTSYRSLYFMCPRSARTILLRAIPLKNIS